MAPQPPAYLRFVRESRLTSGRADFEAWVKAQADEAVRISVYGSDPTSREVNSGRAQVWLEIQKVFQSK